MQIDTCFIQALHSWRQPVHNAAKRKLQNATSFQASIESWGGFAFNVILRRFVP